MKQKHFLPLISIFLFISTSCVSDFDLLNTSTDIMIDESLVLPIGEGSVTIEDLLNKFGLPENFDTTGNKITYNQSFTFPYTYDKLNLADTIKPFSKIIILSPDTVIIPAFFPIILPPYDATVELPINSSSVTDERVDSAIINSAKMKVDFDVSPDLKGIPATAFRIVFDFPDDMIRINSGIKPSFKPVAYGQVGYINIGKLSVMLNGANKIPFKINIFVETQNTNIIISPTSNVILNMKFEDMNYSIVYGLFKLNAESSEKYELPFDYKSYMPNSFLRLANPQLEVSAITNVGMNFNIKIDYFKAYNKLTPDKVFEAMFKDPVSQTKNRYLTEVFEGPTVVGNSVIKIFNNFDSINGDIDHFFDNNPYPNVMDYKISVATNINRNSNYFTADNNLKVNLKVIIPLQFKSGSKFTMTDTIKNLNIGTMLDNVDSAVLVLKIKNGLPVKAKYRMTYWKSDLPKDTIAAIGGSISTITDISNFGNITSQYILNSPTLKPDGTVDQVVPQLIKIMINKEQIDALKLSKYIIYSLDLESDEKDINGVMTSNPINFTTKNSFGVKLGLFVKGSGIVNPFNN